jgi:hypothetical protein
MAKTGFFNTAWSDRGNVERIILLAGAGIGSIVIFRQIGKLTGFIRQTTQNVQTQSELNQWQNVGQTPSYQNTQYLIFADSLSAAMAYWGPVNTDEEAIRNVFKKMNNNADVLKLIAAFGIRDDWGLSKWLTYELDDDAKEKYVNSVLRSKGITYQF